MVDTKSILKKAELFEKLALHSNRENFLQSLSQVEEEILLYDFREKVKEILSSQFGEEAKEINISDFSHVIDQYFELVDNKKSFLPMAQAAAKQVMKEYIIEHRRHKWREFQKNNIGTNDEINQWRLGKSPKDHEGLIILPKFMQLIANILSKHMDKRRANHLVSENTHIIGQYLSMIGSENDLHHQAERAANHLLKSA